MRRSDARRGIRRSRLSLMAAFMLALTVGALFTPPVVAAWDGGTFSSADEDSLRAWINAKRTQSGLNSLPEDAKLSSKARERAKDMGDRSAAGIRNPCESDGDPYSHKIPPDCHTAFDELRAEGYCWVQIPGDRSYIGEILGWSSYPDDQSTANVESMFWGSTSHRNAIIGPDWTRIGVGAYKETVADSNGFVKKVYVVIFAWACGDSGSSTPSPTVAPTSAPTSTPKPTPGSTSAPSAQPTPKPTPGSTSAPSATPSATPGSTSAPSATPSATPTPTPSVAPAAGASPTAGASDGPGASPQAEVTAGPTDTPEPAPATSGPIQETPGLTNEDGPAGLLGSLPPAMTLMLTGIVSSGVVGGGAILIGRRRPPSG